MYRELFEVLLQVYTGTVPLYAPDLPERDRSCIQVRQGCSHACACHPQGAVD